MAAADIDRLVERTLAAYPIPGIAVGVVKDGKLVYAVVTTGVYCRPSCRGQSVKGGDAVVSLPGARA